MVPRRSRSQTPTPSSPSERTPASAVRAPSPIQPRETAIVSRNARPASTATPPSQASTLPPTKSSRSRLASREVGRVGEDVSDVGACGEAAEEARGAADAPDARGVADAAGGAVNPAARGVAGALATPRLASRSPGTSAPRSPRARSAPPRTALPDATDSIPAAALRARPRAPRGRRSGPQPCSLLLLTAGRYGHLRRTRARVTPLSTDGQLSFRPCPTDPLTRASMWTSGGGGCSRSARTCSRASTTTSCRWRGSPRKRASRRRCCTTTSPPRRRISSPRWRRRRRSWRGGRRRTRRCRRWSSCRARSTPTWAGSRRTRAATTR